MRKTLRIIYSLLNPAERRQAAVVIALMLVTACFELMGVGSILPFLTIVMDPTAVERIAVLNWAYQQSGRTNVSDFVVLLGVAILIVIIVMNTVAAFSVWMQKQFAYGFAHALSSRLMARYLSWPYEAFLTRNTSDLSKNVLNETYEVFGGILRPGTAMLSRATVVIALMLLLLALEPLITLGSIAVIGGAYLLVYMLIHHRLARLGKKKVDANVARYKVAAEAFGGLKEVKTLGREAYFLRRYSFVSSKFASYQSTSKTYSQLPRYLIETLAFGGFMGGFVVLMASGYEVKQVVPLLGFFAFAATRLLPGFQEILAALADFKFNQHLLERLHDDLVGGPALDAGGTATTIPFDRCVRLERVSFQYAGAARAVVQDLTLDIPKNTSVALVGATGAGKTTIVDIALGLLVPQQGALLVDDTRITAGNVAAWHTRVGYVPQEVFLSDDTITRNIAFGIDDREIDTVALHRAAAIAHIHDFVIGELPHGYDTVIGERGVRLSGGQRQRLGIARALYHDPEFLVLDEATSDIDNITEEYITEALQSLAGKKTMLIVAHRLTTVRRCDRICLLEDGAIAASGTFDELAAANAVFRRMIHGMRLESGDVLR